MATDLWNKFKSAVRYGWEDGPAAVIATMRGAAATNFTELLAATLTPNGAPTLATQGINIEGLGTVDLSFVFTVAAESAEFNFWLYNGTAWCCPESSKTVTAPAGVTAVYIEPLDLESFQRIYAELVTAPSSGTVAASVGPFNSEA